MLRLIEHRMLNLLVFFLTTVHFGQKVFRPKSFSAKVSRPKLFGQRFSAKFGRNAPKKLKKNYQILVMHFWRFSAKFGRRPIKNGVRYFSANFQIKRITIKISKIFLKHKFLKILSKHAGTPYG